MTSLQEVITLNVGGVLYTTTRSTLTKFGETMLGAMFSGRHHVTSLDRDGNPFIDRDGPMFRHVLNFLRTGRLTLSVDFGDYDLLEAEADFYQIDALAEAARYARPPPSSAAVMSKPQQPDQMLLMFQVDEEIKVHGARSALTSIPLPPKATAQLNSNNFNYQTILILNCDKGAMFDHLLAAGWQLVKSSYAYTYSPVIHFGNRAKCHTTHKYIWCRSSGRLSTTSVV